MILKQKKLFWQIFPISLVILLTTISVVAWFISRSVDRFYIQELGIELENRAHLIESQVVELLNADDEAALRSFAVQSGRASGTRITVITSEGKVLADTNENPATMDNHRLRPEIDAAFSATVGHSMRFSNTLGKNMYYTAIRLDSKTAGRAGASSSPVHAVLRLAMPVTAIDATLSDINRKIIGGAIAAVLIAFLLTYFVTRNISRPLEEMTESAEQFSRGDFSQRLAINHKKTTSSEVATLAAAMDRMAEQLDDKINTIVNQRNQLETVFSSMVEAVIAIDGEERIINLNSAAAKMFGISQQSNVRGRIIHEVIRNVELQTRFQQTLQTGVPVEDEIVLSVKGETRDLHINVVSLSRGAGKILGVLMVLNDVTRLRQLERLRSDFVANVSHELRTPITSIRGYVETLLDGAIDDRDDAVRFLEIVLRQSEQLNEIIDDLLALSRIEKEAKEGDIVFEQHSLQPVLEDALETCRHKAAERDIELHLVCSENIILNMNRRLLEQAVINLLINAITYSEAGGTVTVRARRLTEEGNDKVQISVIDHGIGIARDHLSRLFERFYRSDKARNRKIGGTGLGLAIVKHIVQAHGGSVDVKSTLGEGSEFTISL